MQTKRNLCATAAFWCQRESLNEYWILEASAVNRCSSGTHVSLRCCRSSSGLGSWGSSHGSWGSSHGYASSGGSWGSSHGRTFGSRGGPIRNLIRRVRSHHSSGGSWGSSRGSWGSSGGYASSGGSRGTRRWGSSGGYASSGGSRGVYRYYSYHASSGGSSGYSSSVGYRSSATYSQYGHQGYQPVISQPAYNTDLSPAEYYQGRRSGRWPAR